MQNFRALGAPPPDPRASGGWGLCPQPPRLPLASGSWGLRPQTPPNSPPNCEFLAARLPAGDTFPFQEILQRWRAVGNPVSDLTDMSFEPQTYHSVDKLVAARPTYIMLLLLQCGIKNAARSV